MPVEGSHVDSIRVRAEGDQQAHQLLQSNDVTRLKDTLAGMKDSQLSEVDSCGLPLNAL